MTERDGTIEEHIRVWKRAGHVWWGWWYRQSERVPRGTFAELFPGGEGEVPIVLFDAGQLKLYRTTATRVRVAPSELGLQAPDFDATPDYYLRGRYPAWFCLSEIDPLESRTLPVIDRPTLVDGTNQKPRSDRAVEEVPLEALRDDRPTLWVAQFEWNS